MLSIDDRGLLKQGGYRIDAIACLGKPSGVGLQFFRSADVVDVDVKLRTKTYFGETFVGAVQDPHEVQAEGLYT